LQIFINEIGWWQILVPKSTNVGKVHLMLPRIGTHDTDDLENSILLQIFVNEIG
jgi:hypothetical protein